MGYISEVYYKQIDDDVCTIENASKFYLLANMSSFGMKYTNDYVEYECDQHNRRDRCIKNAYDDGINIDKESSVLGISSIHNKVTFISRLK